jgi:hypothetical protein
MQVMSRIAVVDRAQLRVVDLDRRKSIDLGALGDGRLANRQPVWSPDASRLAWAAFDRRQADSPAAIAVATPEGTSRTDHPAVFPPFYLAWRPDGRAIATLAEGPLGLELVVVDSQRGTSEIVQRGTPLFFAWGTDGSLAVHCGTGDDACLDVRGPGIDTEAFAALRPGSFTAPAFAGEHLVAVVHRHDTPVLGLLDRGAGFVRALATADLGARVVVAPSGRRVAHSPERGAQAPLTVCELDDDTATVVHEEMPALFQWSPDSTSLLLAHVTERGDFPRLRWSVWRNGELHRIAESRVTASFAREVLPFHEQYTRSHTWWSPDSRSFCYTAVDDFGNDTVWVADTVDGGTTRIGTGAFAVWSPR